LWSCSYISTQVVSCRRFDAHCTVIADCRTLLRVGSRIPTRIAMMPMTTSNSTRVNPEVTRRRHGDADIQGLLRRS